METVLINVYSINELSKKAQEKAYCNWLNSDPYFWAEENKNTLKIFEQIFPIKVKDWEYECYNYINWLFIEKKEIAELKGIRLMKYLYNNYFTKIFQPKYYCINFPKYRYSQIQFVIDCPLTGYYMDYAILRPIYNFLKKPTNNITFYKLLNNCLNSWLRTCSNDYQNSISFDKFVEVCKDNNWLFTENGKIL